MRQVRVLAVCAAAVAVMAALSIAVPGERAGVSAQGPSELPIRGVVPLVARDTYGEPQEYLEGGPQSTFTPENAALVLEEVGSAGAQLPQAGRVVDWVRATFVGEPSGGGTIGKSTVNGLMATRVVTGCHDQALLVAAALRLFEIPALMVDTAGIKWAEDFRAGLVQYYAGHVFVEAFIDGRWVIIECGSGQYATDYDTSNPVIPFAPLGPETKGFYVLYKGVDPESYGVTDVAILNERMRQFAAGLPTLELVFPSYRWRALPTAVP